MTLCFYHTYVRLHIYIHVFYCCITYAEALGCLQASNGNRDLPSFFTEEDIIDEDSEGFDSNPIQAIITSYQFTCCGEVTQWSAIVYGNNDEYIENQPYEISFQVWRPSSENSNVYDLVGFNHFTPAMLGNQPTVGTVRGDVDDVETIGFQRGDVVGFFLDSSMSGSDGIQFSEDDDSLPYTNEVVYFASNSISPTPILRYTLGTSGDISSSTSRAPLIRPLVRKFIVIFISSIELNVLYDILYSQLYIHDRSY